MKVVVRIIAWLFGVVVVLAVGTYVAFQVSPWPAVLLIRKAFDDGARTASQGLVPHLPANVTAELNVPYERDGGTTLAMDVFYPSNVQRTDRRLLTVVWVHGGAWISGSKDQNANYSKILASKGFTVVNVDYTIAPEAQYPTPLREVNTALAYLAQHAGAYHVDTSRLVLAGDSAGSQIAAQIANAITDPAYAKMLALVPSIPAPDLKGLLLFCGAYDATKMNMEGSFGGFLRTVMWAYSGSKDFANDTAFASVNFIPYLTSKFPPSFISTGNADPLGPQSHILADALAAVHVRTDDLFFAPDYRPALGHEYQFNLDTAAGNEALARSVAFLNGLH